jgi:hypothetical protein
VVRGTSFLESETRVHGKIDDSAGMIMRMVSVDLERCGMYSVGAEVEVEVVLPDRAMLGRGSPPARSRLRLQRHSVFGLFLQLIT